MIKFFIWLSGADQTLLNRCARLPASERIRFAGFGSLVLIPAVIGLFSMMYAFSTVTHNPLIFVAGGAIWSFVVLSIDRFIVSTVYKSTLKNGKEYIGALISRYVLAVLVGMAVSHPIVLLWFNESINQRIEEKKREAVSRRLGEAKEDIGKLANNQLQEDLRSKTKLRDCKEKLLTAEQSGGEKVQLECGYSSGLPRCEDRCRNILQQINQLDGEIQQLNSRVEKERELADKQRNAIETQTKKDVEAIEKGFSKDYLARVNTLAEIEKDKPHVTVVKWFILLFFVFVEILPLTLKVTTPIGEYEYLRDTLLLDAKLNQDMERETAKALLTDANYISMRKLNFGYDITTEEILGITRAALEFLKELNRNSETFDRQYKEINGRINKEKDEETRKDYLLYLTNMRNLFSEAWKKSSARFLNYIKSL